MKKLAINIVRAVLYPKPRYITPHIAAFLLLITFSFLDQTIRAQDKSTIRLTGTIFSLEDQKPLSGATIASSPANNKTISDQNGKFRLMTTDTSGILSISYIGFKTVKVSFNNKNRGPFDVTLTPDAASLKEVVVSTGYQTLPKERSTGSFVQLDNE